MTYTLLDSALRTPVDFDRIKKIVDHYSDRQFFVEIYSNGTCVFPHVSMGNSVESGIGLLTALCRQPIDFIVKEMDDNNFVVQFTDSVFSVVFRDEFIERRDEISLQAASSTGGEVVLGKPDAPQEHMLIGLYARTRLLADIQTPAIGRIIEPTTASALQNPFRAHCPRTPLTEVTARGGVTLVSEVLRQKPASGLERYVRLVWSARATTPRATGAKKPARGPGGRSRAAAIAGCSRRHS